MRWRLVVGLALITSALLAACGGGSATGPSQESKPSSGTPGTQTPATQTAGTQTAGAQPPPKLMTKAQAASPQVLENMLQEALRAAAESKWADANTYTVSPDAKLEVSEKAWKGILASYYKGDATKVKNTKVMMVHRLDDQASLKVMTPAANNVVVTLKAKSDLEWVIVSFGDYYF